MSDLLNQAQLAAQAEDWGTVALCLQQWLACEQTVTPDQVMPWGSLAIAVLESADFQACWEVAKVLPKLGPEINHWLIALLEKDTAELEGRWFAARILGELGDPIAIQSLVRLMQTSPDEDLVAIAAEALANLGTVAVQSLTALLQQSENRLPVVQALAQIRCPETIPALLSVVQDSNPAVRLAAIEALSSFHDAQVPPLLVQALTDPVAGVRQAALAGLAVRPELAESLSLVNHYTQCLWDLNLDVCRQAAIALGRLGSDAAIAALEQVLLSPNTPLGLQIDIVRALGWTELPAAMRVLQKALQALAQSEAATHVRQEIVAVLGRCQSASIRSTATEILLLALVDSPSVTQPTQFKQAIALALGHLRHPAALDALLQLLQDADLGVRIHALAALKHLDPQLVSQRMDHYSIASDLAAEVRHALAHRSDSSPLGRIANQ